MTTTKRIRIDITDPTNPFVHRGGGRKGHTYIDFYTAPVTPFIAGNWTSGWIVPQKKDK